MKRLNGIYKDYPCLYHSEDGWHCFKWVSVDDSDRSVLAYIRRSRAHKDLLMIVNFVPARHIGYKVELEKNARLVPVISTQENQYGGTAQRSEIVCDENGTAYIDIDPYEGVIFEIDG